MSRPSRALRYAPGTVVAMAALSIIPSWFLGVEQLVPACILLFGSALLLGRGSLRTEAPVVLLGVLWLLGWLSASAAQLDGLGWLTFLQGQFALLAAAAAFTLVASIDSNQDLTVVVGTVATLSCAIVVFAALVSAGTLPLEFRSPVGGLLGSRLPSSPLVGDRILRRVAGADWGRYIRPSVFFLYANFLATALVALSFVSLLGTQRRGGRAGRIFFWWAFAGSLGGILLTRGRAAIMAVLAGLVAWLGSRLIVHRWGLRGLGRAALVAVLVVVVAIQIPIGGRSLLERVLLDVRVHSVVDRLAVYEATTSAIARRPFLGFGIRQSSRQVGAGSTHLRLGSHSDLLNVAYRFGLLGLAIYLTIGVVVLRRWRRNARSSLKPGASRSRTKRFWLAVGAGLIAVGINALLIDIQFDVNAYWLSWILAGMVYAPAVQRETEMNGQAELGAAEGTAGIVGTDWQDEETGEMRLPPPTWRCLGIRFQLWTMGELTRFVVERGAQRGNPVVVGYLNLHGAALARRRPRLSAFYRRANAVHLDGMAMTWLVRALGVPARRTHRITYADWTMPLLAEAARHRRSVFFLGSQPEVAAEALVRLRARFPRLRLESHHGYFDSRPDSPADRRLVQRIREFDPDILLVGMGMPRQEAWILDHAEELTGGVVLAAGACMDYIAGRVKTPPRWAGQMGLEWLFRLIQEPRRLLSRYLVEPWILIWPILREGRHRFRRTPESAERVTSREDLDDDPR